MAKKQNMVRWTFELDKKLKAKARKLLPYGVATLTLREALQRRVELAEQANQRSK